ncbi:hypothetical protein G6F40_014357 [Rhizopus arrhizus]|nr:hypothetical protein G6F40_014357 [Rhizopus arrhizus]
MDGFMIGSLMRGGHTGVRRLRRRQLPGARRGVGGTVVTCEDGVDGGQHEEREQGAYQQAHHDDEPQAVAAVRARAGGEQQRDQPHHHRCRRHQDGTQADAGGLLHRRAPIQPMADLHLVGELHHQDAVLADQADQRHQADLGIDVDGGHAQRQRNQGAADRHGHADQDDERVAQAFVLRRQHQEQEHHSQREDEAGRVARDLLLERDARPFVAVSRGQHLVGELFHRG